MNSALVPTLIGGLIAILGSIATQVLTTRREVKRWGEERRRDAEARVYEHRREAIEAFQVELNAMESASVRMLNEGPARPSDFDDVLDPLWDCKQKLDLYAGQEVREAADLCYAAMAKYINTDLSEGGKELLAAKRQLLSAARSELTDSNP